MQPFRSLLVVLLLLAIGTVGCGKKQDAAADRLQKSFTQAEASVKAEMEKASVALKARNYAEAVTIFNQVLQRHQLADAEKPAIKMVFGEITKAVAADPKLDTPEFYRARAELMEKIYGRH